MIREAIFILLLTSLCLFMVLYTGESQIKGTNKPFREWLHDKLFKEVNK